MKTTFSTIQEVLDNYRAAAEERNVEQFLAGYAEDIQLYDCWGKWECSGKAEWRQSVEAWFSELTTEGITLVVSFSEVKVEEDDQVGFAKCGVTFAAHNSTLEKKFREMTNRFTFGFRKIEDSWSIVHEHSSLPIDMEAGKAIFDSRK